MPGEPRPLGTVATLEALIPQAHQGKSSRPKALGTLPELHIPKLGVNRTLPNGLQGNLETVAFMKRIAHEKAGDPLVQRVARSITVSLPSHQYADESIAVGEFVQNHMRYSRDPEGYEQLQDPVLMLNDISQGIAQGDCDDMSLLIATLLLAIGHRPKFRVVRYEGQSGPYEHIYVVDYEANQNGPVERLVLDAIIKDQLIGYEVPHISGDEFDA